MRAARVAHHEPGLVLETVNARISPALAAPEQGQVRADQARLQSDGEVSPVT